MILAEIVLFFCVPTEIFRFAVQLGRENVSNGFGYHLGIAMRRSPVVDDRALIQIVDSSLADATRRSGEWLVCRQGCTQCCIGVFAINQLDAQRLRRGLEELDANSPERAEQVRAQAREGVARLTPGFPGDPTTRIAG